MVALPQFGRQGFGGMNFVTNKVHHFGEMVHFFQYLFGGDCHQLDCQKQIWWKNYNIEHHYAHRERQDGRHSPSEVLRGVLGRTYPEEVLSRVLYAMQFPRHLDKHGYVNFKHWRFFGEDGLAGEQVSVWVYEGTRHPLPTRPRRSQNTPSLSRLITSRLKQ